MTQRDRSTCDIARGSIWTARDGSGKSAAVIAVNLGFVVYDDDQGEARVLLASIFRKRFEPPFNEARGLKHVKDALHTSLANLEHFHVFWCVREKRLYSRSATKAIADCYKPSRGRGGAVPLDAIHIGTYNAGDKPNDILQDLYDRLAAERPDATAA